MKAILLAAGLGTRLRPITNDIPKCMVKIKGKALIDIWLETLTDAGVRSFLINTHYLSAQVEEHLNNGNFKSQISLVNEKRLLGTAGTIRANSSYCLKQDILLVHADNYCTADFKEFIGVHQKRPKSCLMTLMSFRTNNPESCGILEVDENEIVHGFYEKITNPPGNLANGAVYILSPSVIDWIIKEQVSDFSCEVIPYFLGKIYNFENLKIHIDIGTPETYALAQTT
jgi:mannose-1-phosphate guanylyltransferase